MNILKSNKTERSDTLSVYLNKRTEDHQVMMMKKRGKADLSSQSQDIIIKNNNNKTKKKNQNTKNDNKLLSNTSSDVQNNNNANGNNDNEKLTGENVGNVKKAGMKCAIKAKNELEKLMQKKLTELPIHIHVPYIIPSKLKGKKFNQSDFLIIM